MISTLEVELISVVAARVFFRDATLIRREPKLHLLRERRRDLALRGEQVSHFAIVLLSPDKFLRACVNKLYADAQIIAGFHNAA